MSASRPDPASGTTGEIVIVGAARTPFGKFGGALRDYTHPQLAAIAAREAARRADVAVTDVDTFVLGVNLPGSDRSIARQAALQSGLRDDAVAYTVDRACCSSLSAISLAARDLRAGDATVAIAGGAENMSRTPYFLDGLRFGQRLGDVVLKDQLVISCPHTGVPRAVQAADEALEHGIDRDAQDAWAAQSHHRYGMADRAGAFRDEIIELPELDRDEQPRTDTTVVKLASLPTIYGSRTVTAGNAPGLNTGASAVVLTSAAEAAQRGLQPLATIVATAMVSGAPARIASIPAVAAQKALRRAGLTIDDIDVIEINEAFAAVPLVSMQRLSSTDRGAELAARTNVNGGAIAIGHPTGATGARLVMTLAFELRRRGGGLGLVAICGGIGEGEAMVIRVEGTGD